MLEDVRLNTSQDSAWTALVNKNKKVFGKLHCVVFVRFVAAVYGDLIRMNVMVFLYDLTFEG